MANPREASLSGANTNLRRIVSGAKSQVGRVGGGSIRWAEVQGAEVRVEDDETVVPDHF